MPIMNNAAYLMESEAESIRMEMKTRLADIEKQARWAGVRPGMRIADMGCGPGKTTRILYDMAQPGGQVAGIDFSGKRISRARKKHSGDGLSFYCRDIQSDLTLLGKFDLIWVRFVLEYYRSTAFDIVRRLSDLLNPGGILCLIDLDQNCMNHYDAPPRLATTIRGLMNHLSENRDFDPEAGRKLYSYLYDMNFEDIDVHIEPHHLIYGEIGDIDYFNWEMKIVVAGKDSGYDFSEYPGGFEEFRAEFTKFFRNPRRFTYTPLICCKGTKSHGIW